VASIERVAELFRLRLANDSPGQMEKAAGVWPELPFSFFYLMHAEDTVPIVVTSITNIVAGQDQIVIPDDVIEQLQEHIGPSTVLKDAIRAVFLTTFQA
jgi:hypothetical protein